MILLDSERYLHMHVSMEGENVHVTEAVPFMMGQ